MKTHYSAHENPLSSRNLKLGASLARLAEVLLTKAGAWSLEFRTVLGLCLLVATLAPSPTLAQSDPHALAQRRWFEARTAHFHTYSCGPTQEVAKLTARL